MTEAQITDARCKLLQAGCDEDAVQEVLLRYAGREDLVNPAGFLYRAAQRGEWRRKEARQDILKALTRQQQRGVGREGADELTPDRFAEAREILDRMLLHDVETAVFSPDKRARYRARRRLALCVS